MNRPRKQTYTMDMYLNKIKDMDIRNDSDTQRQFVWSNEQINELIVTVLTEDYIPPIILAEVDSSQLWIVDGGQRSSSFNQFRHGNYKITSAIENSVIPYKKKVKDEQGKIVWVDDTFDIRNKTYDKLPEELKKKFNEYQIETAIHEDCDTHRIAQLIKRYNNHTSMNSNQKAFTYVDNFAREIRNILENRFFLDCGVYTEKERSKGVLERVVLESVMCMFHLDSWKKQPKQAASFLNENSTVKEFEAFQSVINRLEAIVTEDLRDLFSSKDSFIWFTMFNKFSELGVDDERFADFLRAFKGGLNKEIIDGTSYAELDENRATKDKSVVCSKINLLAKLMCEFFGFNHEFLKSENLLSFVQENVCNDVNEEDISLYEEMVNDLVNPESKAIVLKNKPSVISIVAYACMEDVDLDTWLTEYLSNAEFSENQKDNYLQMRDNLEEFLENNK